MYKQVKGHPLKIYTPQKLAPLNFEYSMVVHVPGIYVHIDCFITCLMLNVI